MCVEIEVDGVPCESEQQLAAAMPNGFVKRIYEGPDCLYSGNDEVVTATDSDFCLCHVEIEKTAERNGFRSEGMSGNMWFKFTREAQC